MFGKTKAKEKKNFLGEDDEEERIWEIAEKGEIIMDKTEHEMEMLGNGKGKQTGRRKRGEPWSEWRV